MSSIAFLILAYCLDPEFKEGACEVQPMEGEQCWAWTGGNWGPQRKIVRDALNEAQRYPEIMGAMHDCNIARRAAAEGDTPEMRTIILREMKVGDCPPRYDRYA